MRVLQKMKVFHPEYFLTARSNYRCESPAKDCSMKSGSEISIPKLFKVYLRIGCHVISEPAIDREFGTVDFLVLLDAIRNVKMSALEVVK